MHNVNQYWNQSGPIALLEIIVGTVIARLLITYHRLLNPLKTLYVMMLWNSAAQKKFCRCIFYPALSRFGVPLAYWILNSVVHFHAFHPFSMKIWHLELEKQSSLSSYLGRCLLHYTWMYTPDFAFVTLLPDLLRPLKQINLIVSGFSFCTKLKNPEIIWKHTQLNDWSSIIIQFKLMVNGLN